MTDDLANSAATKVTVGVTGGVAAYKAVELVRLLQKAGLDPHVVLTAGAEQFVTPLTFAAVSGHRVITSLWSGGEVPEGVTPGALATSSVDHIEQAQTTGLLAIVPASAHVIGRLAHGLADDFLTTMFLATRAPVLLAPSMNVEMWQHPAVQSNVRLLRERGTEVIEPGSGYLACGMTGSGRLAELPEIVDAILAGLAAAARGQAQARTLAGQTVLITAGGTREPIDAVRFLGNRSSGRMGYALAAEAAARGARVLLVSAAAGLPVPPGVELVPVATAAEMQAAVLHALPEAMLVIKAAAVADFRPVTLVPGKLPRAAGLTLTLEPTVDIAAEVVRRRQPGTVVVAFAAETDGSLERGREKMARKGVDAIVVNDVSQPGLGFDSDRNAGTLLLSASGRAVPLPAMSKAQMAARILDEAVRLLNEAAPLMRRL